MKLSTEPYKGMRDFYPREMVLQNYIRGIMASVPKRYGYQEYGASILEETDIYRAKTGEEIVNEQTYSFVDRGGRDVTLRPEMTPTVARMVAGKRRDLALPIRWFSIPNCFRYEKPQRGRVREFWQLNIDLLGDESPYADAEVVAVSYDIMRVFGADPGKFVIKINNRALMNTLFRDVLGLDDECSYRLSKLIDKKDKMPASEFEEKARELAGNQFSAFIQFLSAKTIAELPASLSETNGARDLQKIFNTLLLQGIENFIFDPTLMRGFDYYTGMVFEVFDVGQENPRSLFGGGRFDKLVDLFGVQSISAVGFGMGDLPIEGYLETYGLLPALQSEVKLTLCVRENTNMSNVIEFARNLREKGISVALDFGEKKLEKKIKNAKKSGTVFFVVLGDDEFEKDAFVVEKTDSGKCQTMGQNQLSEFLAKI